MFEPQLQEFLDRVDGARLAALMGRDGLPLAWLARSDLAPESEELLAEYSAIMRRIQTAASHLELGPLGEVSIEAGNLLTLLRPLDSSYYLAMVLEPEGNLGLARYLLKAKAPELLAELG